MHPAKKAKVRRKPKDDSVLQSILRAMTKFDMVPEYRFHPTRRWRFDYAWPGLKVVLEKEGGVFMGGRGRHTSGKGFTDDCEKYSVAASMGWLVIRATTTQIRKQAFVPWLADALALRENGGAE